MAKVERDPSGCWIWRGEILRNGYGRFVCGGSRALAHRASYFLHRGPIPLGLKIDHLCRVRACVNPDHLEAVTERDNILRGTSPAARFAVATHCKDGHPLDGRKKRQRFCRTCANEVTRAWRARVKDTDEFKRKNREGSRRWREARASL